MGELRCATVCLPFVLSAARHCVRSHAGHVTERPRLGFPFARSAAAEVNYSCVQIGHATRRRHPITGAVQGGNSVTHSVADATPDWCFDSGRPVELNNLPARRVQAAATVTPRGIYKKSAYSTSTAPARGATRSGARQRPRRDATLAIYMGGGPAAVYGGDALRGLQSIQWSKGIQWFWND